VPSALWPSTEPSQVLLVLRALWLLVERHRTGLAHL
jgi:hypothetical protein